MFAVVVHLKLHPDTAERFLPLIRTNAEASVNTEPGCHLFDVATDSARPDDVFLYELYTDAGAFNAHLETDHFKTFDAASAGFIADKTITTYDRVPA